MVEMDDLAGKVFSLLKGNGLKIKIFDEGGSETTDPNSGRRFFVMKPNIMVTLNIDSNQVEISKGKDVKQDILPLQKNLRKLADEFQMNFDVQVFGKQIQPRDYAYQAKMQRNDSIMENDMKPVNHHLLGTVFKKIGEIGRVTAEALAQACGVDLSAIQPVLNRLVHDGKIANAGTHYEKTVDEAVMEGQGSKSFGEVNFDIKYVSKKDKDDERGYDERKNKKKRADKEREILRKEKNLREGLSKMFGSLKTSQQTLENVRILVKHKTPVDENVRGSRTRHISAIFLECNGERFRFPYNYLPGARAMAQHLAHGGNMADKVGGYIAESTGNLLKLQTFNRYVTTNKLINEDSSDVIDTIKENIETIKNELKKLTGVKTYETVKARLETFERETLEEDDLSQLKDLFTVRRFDEKFEDVLPIVKQLVQEKNTYHKRIEESASNVVKLRRESFNIQTPIFEFASENSKLGYKLSELSLRIMENEELAGFVNKLSTKLCKEGQINNFEKAILNQVLENVQIETEITESNDLKESIDFANYLDKFDSKFY